MPSEHISDCGIGEMPHERWLITECLQWGIDYLRLTVGEPDGFTLEVLWQEHDLGEYPYIGVTWDSGAAQPPAEYRWKWERALKVFDDAIAWSELHPAQVSDRLDEEWAKLHAADEESPS